MSKIIKGKKVGRTRKPIYKSIFGDYDDRDLDKKVMKIPKIINQDIGYEMQLGIKYIPNSGERSYLRSKRNYEIQ